ncbi:MAG: HDOD domain-containing protein [Candidatus Acidiferrales bacterium]
MPRLGPAVDFCRQIPVGDASARQDRKNRVMTLVADGFPVPEGRLFELIRLLGDPVTDLGGVSEILRGDPRLGTQILGLLSSSPLQEYRRAMDVSEAVVLLGSERLRMLVLGCALADFAGRRLPTEAMRAFWHHSLLTALLSQKIAAQAQPESAEQAYFGGLLHDIGRLPLLIVAHEQENEGCQLPSPLHDDPALERDYFGVDHCEVGRWIACCGSFSPWMADILEHHHDPSQALQDASLTAIIAAGDRCCQNRTGPEFRPQPDATASDAAIPTAGELLFRWRPSDLLAEDRAAHSRFLEAYTQYTPFPRFGSC